MNRDDEPPTPAPRADTPSTEPSAEAETPNDMPSDPPPDWGPGPLGLDLMSRSLPEGSRTLTPEEQREWADLFGIGEHTAQDGEVEKE